jgi:hypothetical protein
MSVQTTSIAGYMAAPTHHRKTITITPEITVRKTVRTAISISIGIFAMSSNDAEARIEIITGRRRDRHSHVDLGMGAEDVRRHQRSVQAFSISLRQTAYALSEKCTPSVV